MMMTGEAEWSAEPTTNQTRTHVPTGARGPEDPVADAPAFLEEALRLNVVDGAPLVVVHLPLPPRAPQLPLARRLELWVELVGLRGGRVIRPIYISESPKPALTPFCPYLLLGLLDAVAVVGQGGALVEVAVQGRKGGGPGPVPVRVHVEGHARQPHRQLGLLHLCVLVMGVRGSIRACVRACSCMRIYIHF